MKILSIENNTIKLNSGILEENFGKMSFASIITEEGILVTAEKSGDEFSFEYSPWSFSEVLSFDTEKGREVFYTGKVPFFSDQAAPVTDLLETEKAFDTGINVIRILTDAAKGRKVLPLNGCGGIIYEAGTTGSFKALFLPEKLFRYATAGLSAVEKAEITGLWLNPTLHDHQALRFMRSNLAYRILTGHVPYPSTDELERNADILDQKYLPLELCIPGINEELSEIINRELELNSAKVEVPGKKKKKSRSAKITEGRAPQTVSRGQESAEAFFRSITAFPIDLLINAKASEKAVSDEDFRKKAEDYMARKTSKVNAKRKLRRNAATFLTAGAIFLVVLIMVMNLVKSNQDNKTTKGLTAEQTVEGFFQSLNLLDTVMVSNMTKGKIPNRYADMVSQIYVVSKNRQVYSHDKGFMSPAAYFLGLHDELDINQGGIYGVTNLSVDGNLKDMNIKFPVRKDRPKPVTTDKGISITAGMKSVQTADYYILHTEEDQIVCEHHSDIFTLTFMKDRWVITDITPSAEDVEVNNSKFFSEFFAVLELNGNDPAGAVRIMKNAYPWLPTQNVLALEVERQIQEQNEMMKDFGTLPKAN